MDAGEFVDTDTWTGGLALRYAHRNARSHTQRNSPALSVPLDAHVLPWGQHDGLQIDRAPVNIQENPGLLHAHVRRHEHVGRHWRLFYVRHAGALPLNPNRELPRPSPPR